MARSAGGLAVVDGEHALSARNGATVAEPAHVVDRRTRPEHNLLRVVRALNVDLLATAGRHEHDDGDYSERGAHGDHSPAGATAPRGHPRLRMGPPPRDRSPKLSVLPGGSQHRVDLADRPNRRERLDLAERVRREPGAARLQMYSLRVIVLFVCGKEGFTVAFRAASCDSEGRRSRFESVFQSRSA